MRRFKEIAKHWRWGLLYIIVVTSVSTIVFAAYVIHKQKHPINNAKEVELVARSMVEFSNTPKDYKFGIAYNEFWQHKEFTTDYDNVSISITQVELPNKVNAEKILDDTIANGIPVIKFPTTAPMKMKVKNRGDIVVAGSRMKYLLGESSVGNFYYPAGWSRPTGLYLVSPLLGCIVSPNYCYLLYAYEMTALKEEPSEEEVNTKVFDLNKLTPFFKTIKKFK